MPDAQQNESALPADRIGAWVMFGLLTGCAMLAGIGVWSLNTRVDGAVIAPGMVGLETDRQLVQHLEGGIVSEILVREDQPVRRGDTLITMDTTQDQAELNANASQLANLTIRRERLRAELGETGFDPDMPRIGASDTLYAIIAAERQLFDNRRAARAADAALLQTRRQALEAQIVGLQAQDASLTADRALTAEELQSIQHLHDKGLTPVSRLLEVRRRALEIEAGLSGNAAQVESLRAQIAEVDSQLDGARATLREELAVNLAEIDQQLRELHEIRTTLQDRVRRSRILAPRDGRILNLAAHTKGGVIAPGQTVMEIVPVQEKEVLLANVPVTEIDRIAPGMPATVRLTAFNRNRTPELEGRIRTVSADTLTDAATGVPYYSAEIELTAEERARLDGQELVPGMPVEVMISTGERLVVSYLSRPLSDAFSATFRDE